MNSERSKVDKELRRLGFGGLDDQTIVSQIAFCIRDHEQFKSQLFSVDPEKRRLAYNQLRPHLNFAAKPLDVYEAEMKLMAEEQQLPVWDGSTYPKPFKVPELTFEGTAELAIENEERLRTAKGCLTLVCSKCTVEHQFPGVTRVDAAIFARKTGWKLTQILCPKCNPDNTIQ